jgi:hypothetical protein
MLVCEKFEDDDIGGSCGLEVLVSENKEAIRAEIAPPSKSEVTALESEVVVEGLVPVGIKLKPLTYCANTVTAKTSIVAVWVQGPSLDDTVKMMSWSLETRDVYYEGDVLKNDSP